MVSGIDALAGSSAVTRRYSEPGKAMRSPSIDAARGIRRISAARRARIGSCRALVRQAGKALIALISVPLSAAATEPPAARQAELLHMLRHDCGACHGLRLDGGLGPPLTAAALARHTPQALERMILEGRPGTPMPPWKALLSSADVRWMVRAMRSGKAGE